MGNPNGHLGGNSAAKRAIRSAVLRADMKKAQKARTEPKSFPKQVAEEPAPCSVGPRSARDWAHVVYCGPLPLHPPGRPGNAPRHEGKEGR